MPGGGSIPWTGQPAPQNFGHGPNGQPAPQTQPQGQSWQVQPQPQGQPAQPVAPQIFRDSNGIQYSPQQLPPPPPQPQWPGQPPAQPQPQPWGQRGQQPPGQPAPQPGQGNTLQVNDQTILDGPGVPPELRGRSMGEFNRIYAGLRQIALGQTQPGQIPQPQPIPAPQPQPQPGAQPQPGQGQPQPPQITQADFMRDPAGSVNKVVESSIQRVFQQQLLPMLAPLAQQTNDLGIKNAMAQVASEIGAERFQQLLPEIQQQLQGIHPSALANPHMWRVAAQSVVGARALSGQPFPQPAQQSMFATPAAPFPVQFTNGNPVPGVGMFWSEPPGGQRGSNGVNGISLSPQEQAAAKMMNMTESEYAAWKGGVARS